VTPVRKVDATDQPSYCLVNSATTMMGYDPAALESLTRRVKARRELPPPETQRALRRAAGASLADVAKVVGTTRQAVSLWELGRRSPTGGRLDAYLEVLRVFREAAAHPTPKMTEPGSFPGSRGSVETNGESTG
jgi:DNA-binding transcriptional regulator YiaG